MYEALYSGAFVARSSTSHHKKRKNTVLKRTKGAYAQWLAYSRKLRVDAVSALTGIHTLCSKFTSSPLAL
jgi:hypothetical protein